MDDLISRQAAIKKILLCENHDMEHDFEFNQGLIVAMNAIEELPTAEPKKGKWIEDDDATVRGHCSVCGWESHYYEDDVVGANYCPNCGARMEE